MKRLVNLLEAIGELVSQFFNSWVFDAILSTILIASLITLVSFMIKRSEKNEKEIEKHGWSLSISAFILILCWGFYSMRFEEYGSEELNLVLATTFSTFAVFAAIVFYDKWKNGQRTLDKYI